MTLHKKNHITRTLLAVSMLAMSGGALAAQVPPGTQLAEKQELVRNNGSEPASLDPHKVESDVEFNIISDLFEGLVNVSPAGAIQPRLAERWENKDNLLWTFHLRPGLTWSDGTAITAQDIVWSWQRLVSPATASPYASYPGNMHIANAREIALGQKGPETLGVKALNDTTLQVTLTQPNAAFLAMLALTLFIRYSRMGRACRACAEDLKMASLLGINTDRVIALTFVIGAAMAAVAGVLLGQFYGVINPYIGFMAGMKAFTAAVLGGIGSIPGAMIGGLILGIAEALSSAYLSTEYKDVVSFALLILVLLVMPTGILGRPEVEKV